jgi:hypothetical protein
LKEVRHAVEEGLFEVRRFFQHKNRDGCGQKSATKRCHRLERCGQEPERPQEMIEDWTAAGNVGTWEIRELTPNADGLSGERFATAIHALTAKARAVVDAVSRDDNGIMVAGQWTASNGGMLSRETIAAADALRRELENWKAR